MLHEVHCTPDLNINYLYFLFKYIHMYEQVIYVTRAVIIIALIIFEYILEISM